MSEARLVVSIPAEAWESLCDRAPWLAAALEVGDLSALSDAELMVLLVVHGVPVDRPSGDPR
jgi:hypothetical protein